MTLGLILLALLCSGYFSGAETALLSVNRVRIRHRMEAGDPRAAIVWSLLQKPEPLFMAILLAVNVCNVAAAALATSWLRRAGYPAPETLSTLTLTPIILLFAELLPKAVGRRVSGGYTLESARFLDLSRLVLSPAVWLIDLVAGLGMRLLGVPKNVREQFVTRDEIKTYVEGEGGKDPGHRQMLRGAWQFARTSVREVMIPLTRVRALPTDARLEEALELGRRHGHARFPVYEDRIDNVVGIVDLGEVLYAADVDPASPVRELAREPLLLPNTLASEKAILSMQQARETMAVVIDEYGGCDGIVLMKDMFEEVVGDLEGPVGMGPELYSVGPRLYIARGQVDLDTLNDELGLDLPKHGYETLSGFLMTSFEAVPRVGQKLRTTRATFEVLETRARTAARIRIRLH